MLLIDYTSYAAIRAILGVATAEIRDTVLALPIYLQELERDLYKLNPTLSTQYATVKAIDEGSRSPVQARFFNLCQLYCGYAVAAHLLNSLEMFAPKRLTDGSATMERNQDAWASVREAVSLAYNRLKIQLLDLLEELDPSQPAPVLTTRRYSGNVGLNTDPVTGA